MSALLFGTGKEQYTVTRYFGGEAHRQTCAFEGIIPMIDRRRESYGLEYYETLLEEQICPECGGGRLNKMMLAVTVGGLNIYELCRMPIDRMLDFVNALELTGGEAQVADEILKEIRARLSFLCSVGLEYLNLARRAGTLSGGEAQRIRLATQIGSSLVGVLYILDEPSIGLHQRDNDKLIDTLKRLRDLGNTVVVVEHDEDTMRAADFLVDIGPGAGVHGGEIIAAGTPKEVAANPASVTGAYLSGRAEIPCRPHAGRATAPF